MNIQSGTSDRAGNLWLCENAGVALSVVEQIVLAGLSPWALEGVKGCCFLTASKLSKGRIFDLLALPAPASRIAIGISCVCLLFVLPFGNCRLASSGVSAWHCAVQWGCILWRAVSS